MALYRPPHLRRVENAQSSASTGPSLSKSATSTNTDVTKEVQEVEPIETEYPVYGQTKDAQIGATAIAEKRRLYVGNMPYFAKEEDVRALFHGRPMSLRERLVIAIDPFTGRNPSYCFVDLPTAADAERAMAELNERDLLGRPIRVKLGVPHQVKKGGWPFPPNQTHVERLPGRGRVWDRWQKTETEAASHWRYTSKGARVFVGNLPGFANPARVDAEIKEFFKGFEIVAISKIIQPRSADPNSLPHHTIGHYLFVDLISKDEADRAVRTLNCRKSWNRIIKVALPTDTHSWKVEERDRYLALNPPSLPGEGADW